MKYKFKNVQEEGYKILEDGHTMFPEDVRKRLNRLEKLGEENKELVKDCGIYMARKLEYEVKCFNAEKENKRLKENIRNSQIENANFKNILKHLLNYVPYDNLIDYFDEHELDVINKLQQD